MKNSSPSPNCVFRSSEKLMTHSPPALLRLLPGTSKRTAESPCDASSVGLLLVPGYQRTLGNGTTVPPVTDGPSPCEKSHERNAPTMRWAKSAETGVGAGVGVGVGVGFGAGDGAEAMACASASALCKSAMTVLMSAMIYSYARVKIPLAFQAN